jgi:hypothetical protein
MKHKNLLWMSLLFLFILLTVFLIKKVNTENLRQNEIAVDLVPEIATDPSFTELKAQITPGFPSDFPVYNGATLVGSATDTPSDYSQTYRVKWDLAPGTSTVDAMQWYKKELTAGGWGFEDPDSWANVDEFVAQIQRDGLKGYIAVENESGEIEVVVDLKNINEK